MDSLTSNFVWNLFVMASTCILVVYLKNYLKAVYAAFLLPGPPALPLLGNALAVYNNNKLESWGIDAYKQFGPIVRTWISVIPFFLILEPQHLQILLSNSKTVEKNMFYKFLRNFLGEGLITSNGMVWKTHRRYIQPYFNLNVLEIYVSTFGETSLKLVEELKQYKELSVTGKINDWVLETLHQTVLGISATDELYKQSPFRKGEVIVPYRITRPWLLFDTLFKMTNSSKNEEEQRSNLQAFAKKILDKKRLKLKTDKSESHCLMDMLMEISDNQDDFDEKAIIDETCTFMLAGQDSVAATLAFTLYYLGKHQDVQEKAFQEQQSIFGEDLRPPTFDNLNEMKYLEQCLKETMRLCPSVPIVSRILNHEVTLGKTTLPAGSNLFISPFATHRLEHFFPKPLEFDPDRFSSENIKKIHPFAYIPFMAGPRNCLGYKFSLLEMKTLLSVIIRNFHITPKPGKEEVNLSYRITLRAKGGIWLQLRDRRTA